MNHIQIKNNMPRQESLEEDSLNGGDNLNLLIAENLNVPTILNEAEIENEDKKR